MAGPGRPKTGGRRKGVQNKVTREIREALIEAFDQAGGVAYLVERSKDQPVAFMAMLGRLLPSEIKASIEGESPLVRIFCTRGPSLLAVAAPPERTAVTDPSGPPAPVSPVLGSRGSAVLGVEPTPLSVNVVTAARAEFTPPGHAPRERFSNLEPAEDDEDEGAFNL